MKAPDKIYMPHELLTEDWSRHIEDQDTCYIRKDTLLEWAKEHAQRLESIFNLMPSSVVGGKLDAYKDVIDKISSL